MKNVCFFCIITAILFSCKKDNVTADQPSNYSITGVAQKGPFPQGSKVTVYELNGKLEQTGKVFKTETSDDFGTFELKDMLLNSSFVQVEVEGNPFNEVYGSYIMGDDIALSNIVDLRKGIVVNVNLLSDLARQRTKYLIQNGTGFDNAKTQAEREVMEVFGLDSFYVSGSEKMDITQSDDAGGSLLALSAIFLTASGQQHTMFLQQYIAKVRSDIETDGILSDTTLSYYIKIGLISINQDSIINNLSSYYQKDIPSFSKFIDVAIQKLAVSYFSHSNIIFPAINNNILALPKDTNYLTDTIASIILTLPSDGYKNIRLTIQATDISKLYIGYENTDWALSSQDSHQKVFEMNEKGKTEQFTIMGISNSGFTNIILEDISQSPTKILVRKWIEFNHI